MGYQISKRFLVVLVLLATWTPLWASPRVLLLNSYHHGYAWTDDMTRGVIDGLPGVRVHVDFMDTKREYDEGYLELLDQVLVAKYANESFDAVVCTDNNAFDFMRGTGRIMYPDTPVVYTGVNFIEPADLDGLTGFTGIAESNEFGPTFALMRSLFPDRDRLWVVVDSTVTGTLVEEGIREALDRDSHGFSRITILSNLAISDLEERVGDLGPRDALFYAFYFRDANGRFLESTEGIGRVAERSAVPIFTAWDFNLGQGALGGYVAEAYQLGLAAADLTQRILDGDAVSSISPVWDTPESFVFDFREMQRFGIRRRDLPPNSTVRFVPQTIWYRYRIPIVGTGTLIVALTALLILVSANLRIRRKAEAEILQVNESLEQKVTERTHELMAMVRTLKATQDRLVSQERLGAVGSMVSGIAHEINTPLGVSLTGITHLKEYLERFRGKTGEETPDVQILSSALEHAAEATDLVAGGIHRTAELVDRFRLVALDRLDMHRRSFALREYLRGVTEDLSHREDLEGLSFTVFGPEMRIDGFPDVFRQIVAALASNSRMHGYPSGREGEMKIELSSGNPGYGVLEISDTGTGIPEEYEEHLFEPFFAFRTPGNTMGLGLHLVYRLVKERLGGSIEHLKDKPGAHFRVTFPLQTPGI